MSAPDTKNTIRPFQSIESALEFMVLLESAIEEASAELQGIVPTTEDKRENSGVTLALFKLQQLADHVHKSRRILNDLTLIRGLMTGPAADPSSYLATPPAP